MEHRHPFGEWRMMRNSPITQGRAGTPACRIAAPALLKANAVRPALRASRRAAVGLLAVTGLCLTATAATPAVFARLTPDRADIYHGEQFVVTLAVYTAGETLGRQISLAGMPDAASATFGAFEELPNESTVIEGRVYDIRRYRNRARANRAGLLRLAPQLQGTLVRTVRAMWFTQSQEQAVTIPVEPLDLPIREVPAEGRPAGFSGAVGQFAFVARAEPLDVAPGDLVTVTMTLSGEGLPDVLTPPSVPAGPGLKVYEVKLAPARGEPGRRVYEQTIVAAEPFAKAIPAVAFSYFDPRERRYRTASAGPFPLVFHSERAPTTTVYTPPATTAAAPAAAVSAAPAGPGRLVRAWHALTGQHFAVARPGADTPARFAPGGETPILFVLKPGTRVRLEGESQGWVRISCHDGIGWVPAGAIAGEP